MRSAKGLGKILDEELPDAVYAGLSVMTTQIPSALQISERVRKFNPRIKIIWGGAHVTFFTKETLESDLVDFAISHEGEETLWELIQTLESPKPDFSKIKGLGYKDGGRTFNNSKRELLPMSEIPLPNWDLVPTEILERLELVPTHTSRGCPHRCAFCINAITKNRWRMREPEKVLEDIEIIQEKPYFKEQKSAVLGRKVFCRLKRELAL